MKQAEDSDNIADEEDMILKEQIKDSYNTYKGRKYEPLSMIMDNRGFMYYIVHEMGLSSLMEGNPQDPYIKRHYPIFTLQTSRCFAFTCQTDRVFYLMDD